MSDGYWVDRVEGLDDPTPIIREALEKSIQEGSLKQFNTELQALVKRDKNGHILESTPLELVPLLLLANETITFHPQPLRESYELIARHGSPKEILLVVQESLDALLQEAKELENDEESASSTPTQIVWKWLRLIDMYSLSFPRLVPRKRSAPETAAPIIQHLRDSFSNLAVLVDTNEPASQEIVEACIRLGYSLLGWFEAVGSEVNEVADCKIALKELLCVALAECLSDKHILRSYDDFLHRLRTAGLDFTPTYALEPRSKMTGSTRTQLLGEFVLYYLSNQGPVRPKGTRQALREHLNGLSAALHRPRWRQTALGAINDCVLGGLYEEEFLEEDIAAEMIPIVSTPASTDPDSKSRSVLFNLLTQMILKVQPVHAFKFVRDLASEECPYLNMRSSAIGLLRRLVVRAFNRSLQAEDDPFASRLLLEEYKPILFQSPILEKKEAGPESIDAQEMNRLVEILGFFYVLLARDKNNLTGVRDTKGTQELRDRIVGPLKAISSELESTSEDPSVLFSVRSISVSLERIEEMVSGIEDRSI
ncbi:hypothetical protein BN14_07256 [Rhizoctonia solani AG-1 IB]|uniref:Uncharacterized protein n=2 Tax=Thanatephorus cucumeris (strain AG1-IB / isolate 7/3/14) TaxID=1108050 RepID=M5C1D4_THACB|nr:hypothetical protein BN14_07256 [Rhizoctonia solani AG-1 IB]